MSDKKPPKPKKHLVIFLIMGFIGTNLEIGARWIGNDLVNAGFLGLRFESGAGWTSLWMFFVYGVAGVLLGELNTTRVGRWPMLFQALVGLAIMLAIELASGCVLNLWLDLRAWNYQHESIQFQGQICARVALQFFAIAPLAFWVDDMIRFIGYDERRPGTLWAYYRALLEREPDPQRRAAAEAPTRLCASCSTNPEGPPVPRAAANAPPNLITAPTTRPEARRD